MYIGSHRTGLPRTPSRSHGALDPHAEQPQFNLAALPAWANYLLLFVLFVVAPCTGHLLDSARQSDAAKAVAAQKASATPKAQHVAARGE